jgi:hypothetical protein
MARTASIDSSSNLGRRPGDSPQSISSSFDASPPASKNWPQLPRRRTARINTPVAPSLEATL